METNSKVACFDHWKDVLQKDLKIVFENLFNNVFNEIWLTQILYDLYKFDLIQWNPNDVQPGMMFKIESFEQISDSDDDNDNDTCEEQCEMIGRDQLTVWGWIDKQHIVQGIKCNTNETSAAIIYFQTIGLCTSGVTAWKNTWRIVTVPKYNGFYVYNDHHADMYEIRIKSLAFEVVRCPSCDEEIICRNCGNYCNLAY
jgi:hypothetical protein